MKHTFVLICILFCGCSSVNRNIITVIDSGVGTFLDYNVQTQMPQVRMGMARSSIFVVPTSLNTGENGYGGSASDAPNVLARQKINVGIMSGIQIDDLYVVGAISSNQMEIAKTSITTIGK
jgi:hypothetical protein